VKADLDASEQRTDADGCHVCGATLLRTDQGALCPACLFAAGLSAGEERVGPYALLQALESGGSGTVHIARRFDQEGLVAIKLARPELLESAECVAVFRNGVRLQQTLRHQPNIVSIDDIGTSSDGRPYAVMPLLDGGTLADGQQRRHFADPARALALLIKITRAVTRAHQRGVLHCDLKPANVLFNDEGEPFVSDFGLARTVGPCGPERGAWFQGGTLGWMSPEQAQLRELTLASDVFSLGVMLYWLLTGALPFGEGEDFVQRVVNQPARPLGTLYTGPRAWELEQICARALQKDPEQRYRSAAELADDLERARDGEPIEIELKSPARLAAKWIRRHKLAALAGVELCMLLLYLPLLPISLLHEVKSTFRDQLAFSAAAQAGAVMNELRARARKLERLALDPEIKRLVHYRDPMTPPAALEAHATGSGDDREGLSVFSADGILQARWPAPSVPHRVLNFRFRDYFQGQLRFAQANRRDVYVGRPYHAQGNDVAALALSTPLYEGDRHLGALISQTQTRATFGAVRMNCGPQGTCMTALLGPRDRDAEGEPLPRAIFVLAAPGLAVGQRLMIGPPLARRICAQLECQPGAQDQFEQPARMQPVVLDDYEDPISHARSIAAFAPVGRTGLIAVVATPNAALTAITERMTHQIKAFLWVPLSLGLLLLGGVLAAPRLRIGWRRR
jgi:serine/threonine protein kinase